MQHVKLCRYHKYICALINTNDSNEVEFNSGRFLSVLVFLYSFILNIFDRGILAITYRTQ